MNVCLTPANISFPFKRFLKTIEPEDLHDEYEY